MRIHDLHHSLVLRHKLLTRTSLFLAPQWTVFTAEVPAPDACSCAPSETRRWPPSMLETQWSRPHLKRPLLKLLFRWGAPSKAQPVGLSRL
mmetsp:Transcript_8895/g.25637  ORF Transcript_8895/g.25637 Transcript_8895/m.25637 type:complete len:91 (-) Transcript_8895:71-343(-)